MKLAVPLLVLACIFGCKKDSPPPPPAPAPAEPFEDTAEAPAPAEHPADALAEIAEPGVQVSEELVLKYLAYRKKVVERGQAVVKAVVSQQAEEKAKGVKLAGSVRAKVATEDFVERMRKVEDEARETSGLSRDEVVAVGQVVGEVLAARQIWQRTGGDDAVASARAELEKLSGEAREKAQALLEAREKSFANMRDAKSARERFGDQAVDAVLAHEKALWEVQREGAKVMAAVY